MRNLYRAIMRLGGYIMCTILITVSGGFIGGLGGEYSKRTFLNVVHTAVIA